MMNKGCNVETLLKSYKISGYLRVVHMKHDLGKMPKSNTFALN